MHFEKLKLLKAAVFAGCLIALIIESYNLFKEYLEYQTVVTVNITRQSVVSFPGVSICESNRFINLKEGNLFNQPNLPVQKGLWIKAKQKNVDFTMIMNGSIEDGDYLSYFMDFDIPIKESVGPLDDGFIICHNKATGEPCSPVNHVSGFFSQCMSFFNTIDYANGSSRLLPPQMFHIVDNSRDNEMAEIKITKNETNDYHTNQVTVLVIPANSIPAFSKQKLAFRQDLLKFGRRYDVTFSKTTIMKLPKPYKPYCHDYKSTDYVKSYYDCGIRCIHRLVFEALNCSLVSMDVIVNEEFSEKRMCRMMDLTLRYKPDLIISAISRCGFELCLPDCIQEIYNYEIKDVTDSPSFINEKLNDDTIIIKLLPQDADEFTYIHQPKLSRNDLFSKFGGLLSLWLGFSFFSIYNYIEHVILNHFAKVRI